jgi:nucleotide-binding universal stress UspA family protein
MSDTLFQTTVCPVDFSELSADALRFALRWARSSQVRLIVGHANWFEAPAYFTETQVQELQRQFREAVSQAEDRLRAFTAEAIKDESSAPEIAVVDGLPADAILNLTARTRAGLIIMGTHGRTGWNRWTLGSVAERVLRESPVPVITVRGGAEREVRKILCPVDDTALSRQALQTAAAIASRFDADLTALHVAEPGGARPVTGLCEWADPQARAHCAVRELVHHGDPAEEIVSLSQDGAFDLIVLGAPRRRFFDGMVLGSTTLRVVRHAGCPVLTVPGQ